jgi:antitoxin (DNA-binding transcriptional repressor) of toxin-antitoxin stability system
MQSEIDAYDARTRLPELLRQVKAGNSFSITDRGEAIADLVPSAAGRAVNAGAAIERFQEFMRNNPIAAPSAAIRALVNEGRE